MKNLLIMALLLFGAYQTYQNLYQSRSFSSATGADVVLFTSATCYAPCADARSLIRQTGLSVEEVQLGDGDTKKLSRFKAAGGGGRLPLLLTKQSTVVGFHRIEYLSALADSEGLAVLPKKARGVLGSHFENGEPKLVMYGTKWCPYCKKARAYFADRGLVYEERDVEDNHGHQVKYKWLNGAGYPLIYFGAKRFDGFNTKALDKGIGG